MPRSLLFLIIVVILLAGGLYLLSGQTKEVPVRTIEANVEANAAS